MKSEYTNIGKTKRKRKEKKKDSMKQNMPTKNSSDIYKFFDGEI